ncbi:MAG: hypothetical protein QXJ97_04535 [Desulfurococcaceae archaeon]
MPSITIFGKEFIIKQLRAPRFKKQFTLATPPPWYRNPGALSEGQVAQIMRLSAVAVRSRGKRLKELMAEVKAKASGPTGYRKVKERIYLPRIGRILTLAEKYGIPIPEELRTARPVPVTAPAVPRIRE